MPRSFWSEKIASVSYADITTGEFAVTELPIEALRAELTRLHPAEILHPDNQTLNDGIQGHKTPYPAWRFEPGKCEETLLSHFKASTLEGFGIKGHSLPMRAAGAIIQYLKDTQPDSLSLLTSLRSYSINEFMTLDAATRRNLELDETLRGERKGSLLGTLDQTVTPMGKRMIHQWVSQPLLNVERIKRRQNGVQYFFDDGMKRAELRAALKPLADLERLVNRVLAGLCTTARPGCHARYTFATIQYPEYYRSGQVADAYQSWNWQMRNVHYCSRRLMMIPRQRCKTRALSGRAIRRNWIRSLKPHNMPGIGSRTWKRWNANGQASRH